MSDAFDWNRWKGTYVRFERPGTVVEGVLTRLNVGSYLGKEYPELTLRTYDGDEIVSASPQALQRALADDPPMLGDTVRIEYLGEATTAAPGYNPAKLFKYSVVHQTVASAPPPGAVAQAPAAQPSAPPQGLAPSDLV